MARLHFERDKVRYAIGRARLRQFLAAELDASATDIRIEYGPHGKPQLGGDWAHCGLRFNLSHSGDLALIGVTDGPEIGVDLERRRHVANEAAIAHRYLSPEQAAGCGGFFDHWTRHEALVKAQGRSLVRAHDVAATGDWCSTNFEAAAGFAAAVAVPGRYCELRTVHASDRRHLT